MQDLRLFTVDEAYVDYLIRFAPHMFHNSQTGQTNTRKYIGVILSVNGIEYFAPLSSMKPKHRKMKESVDFLKVGDYAVININNMFPVPNGLAVYVDFSKERDPRYRSLLLAEYRIIKQKQDLIRKNAQTLYRLVTQNKGESSLLNRCNDFELLEKACKEYQSIR
ncbi:MAG: type III toxin-antitoxin system ToxN/AbiQ family toxin [Clostridia bacterium]|nr:type III toxin-antitoxin system ToxN/AbiQ family toxin [Clostridia bacterium]